MGIKVKKERKGSEKGERKQECFDIGSKKEYNRVNVHLGDWSYGEDFFYE